jgi:hypothetical protein
MFLDFQTGFGATFHIISLDAPLRTFYYDLRITNFTFDSYELSSIDSNEQGIFK